MNALTRHWRSTYGDKYLGASHLWDEKTQRFRNVTVVIESAGFEEVVGEMGRKSTPVVLHFKGKRTPMIVTRKQGKVLEQMFGRTLGEWQGKTITIWVETGVRVKDGTGDVLRIKNEKAGQSLKNQLRGTPEPPPDEPLEQFGDDEENDPDKGP